MLTFLKVLNDMIPCSKQITTKVNNMLESTSKVKEQLIKDLDDKQSLVYKKLRSVWYQIEYRCNKPTNPSYKKYGARGIQVCDEWRFNFREFALWCIFNGYVPLYGGITNDTLSVDRIDPTKGYNPNNCRIITHHENSVISNSDTSIKVHAYSATTGDYINTYSSFTEASTKLGVDVSKISECAYGTRKTSNGYCFKLRKLNRITVPKDTRISGVDIEVRDKKTNEVYGVFGGVKEIANDLGIPTSNISKVLKGKRKSAKGYTFTYL